MNVPIDPKASKAIEEAKRRLEGLHKRASETERRVAVAEAELGTVRPDETEYDELSDRIGDERRRLRDLKPLIVAATDALRQAKSAAYSARHQGEVAHVQAQSEALTREARAAERRLNEGIAELRKTAERAAELATLAGEGVPPVWGYSPWLSFGPALRIADQILTMKGTEGES